MALILKTLDPSSAPENLNTAVAMSTLASSGVNEIVMSSFYLPAMDAIEKISSSHLSYLGLERSQKESFQLALLILRHLSKDS